MKTFLLIHGGSHGAWCWESVIQELDHLGCKSYAIDLPGGGNDKTPRESVTRDRCVSAVNQFIQQYDIRDFVLVGHSLAGILLPDIAAANKDRVKAVVFLASFVLNEGERVIDVMDSSRVPEYYRLAEASSEYSLMPNYASARQRFFSDMSESSARIAYSKLTPQPFAPYLAPARYGAQSIRSISRYIICRDDQNFSYDMCQHFAKKVGGKVDEIEAGHDVMLSRPKELATLLAK